MPWQAIKMRNGDHRVAFVMPDTNRAVSIKAHSYGSEAAAQAAAEGFNTGKRSSDGS